MKNKVEKIKWIYREEGLRSVISYSANFVLAKMGWFRDQWIFGRLVEIFGNKVHLNGCTFSVDSPFILTVFKCRFILGRYETKERQTVVRFLDPSLPVVELGSSIGIVSCITNKKLINPKNHVVVEANPNLISLLKTNRDLNNCQFKIINKASGYGSKEVIFYQHDRFTSGGLQRPTNKPISVESISLEEILTDNNFEYSNLICDIEGGEIDLIAHEKDFIAKRIYQIIFDLHPSIVGEEKIHLMCEELKAAGFNQIKTYIYGGVTYGDVLLFENSNIKKILHKK
ncbi:MAG: FkbM family methyltransferase [Candidatus Nomurabacteria bacterium]|nr:FkbM family methyltransferase [Candidatus Nomurabacteria bacterium]